MFCIPIVHFFKGWLLLLLNLHLFTILSCLRSAYTISKISATIEIKLSRGWCYFIFKAYFLNLLLMFSTQWRKTRF